MNSHDHENKCDYQKKDGTQDQNKDDHQRFSTMKLASSALAGAGLAIVLSTITGPVLAQKSGGILKLYHRGTPPSGSIHEEATNSTTSPYKSVFNNLVMFDQHKPTNSIDTIVPDLAESWSWNDDKTQLTFKLRDGVQWHDGKPFSAKDVECTWNLIHLSGTTC